MISAGAPEHNNGSAVKLMEALELARQATPETASELEIFLACGFTPLHLEVFLTAGLRQLLPAAKICIRTGIFGDLPGNVEKAGSASADSAVVLIEWSDLDPRLAIRTLGGWKPEALGDIVASAEQAAARIEKVVRQSSDRVPTLLCLPTLPLPPLFPTQPAQAGPFELRLRHAVTSLAVALAEFRGLRIVNPQLLDELSPLDRRYDPKSDVMNGFPYSLPHASQLGQLLAKMLVFHFPKKGLITDLDDTLWAGIAGEDGVDALSWSLDHGHLHGLYQQFLASLSGAGVLVGVASKNDPAVVKRAFARSDLLISPDDIFPCETGWGRKSESIERILKSWNISADAVVFIDDSPMEVAEIRCAFPGMECLVFPRNDYARFWRLLRHLRDEFGKPLLAAEDSLRLGSIRADHAWRGDLSVHWTSADAFLKGCDALITLERIQDDNPRAFELLNKTNQFNLNGRRFSEARWRNLVRNPAYLVLSAAYQDKYGRLGTIAVIVGRICGTRCEVEAWVMSCRAFSRRIEHQCLRYLFDCFGLQEIAFDYERTARNHVLGDFLTEVLGAPAAPGVVLSKPEFERRAPALFHRVEAGIHV